VKIDEHIYIHELPAETRHLLGRSDVFVARPSSVSEPRPGTGVLEAPAQVRLPAVDVERLSFVEIRDRMSRQLITVIELLSPSNKQPGPDRAQHLATRGQLFASAAHVVEIDLLRGGPRLPLEGLPDCDYYVLCSRVEKRPIAEVWPLSLRQRLPVMGIPLRSADADAQLDLQQVLDRIYDAAGYEDYIYQNEPQPRLTPDDAAWAQQYLPAQPSA
jgi:hypothetical protein